MHISLEGTINFDPAITGTMMTRLGSILFSPDDIYSFNEGLAGFKGHTKFVRTHVPKIPSSLRYGMLQSLEDSDLSFVLFYPTLDASQQEIVLRNVRLILGDIFIQYDDIDVAFLVIVNKDVAGKSTISFVKDAPLVFLKTTRQAWQMVLV